MFWEFTVHYLSTIVFYLGFDFIRNWQYSYVCYCKGPKDPNLGSFHTHIYRVKTFKLQYLIVCNRPRTTVSIQQDLQFYNDIIHSGTKAVASTWNYTDNSPFFIPRRNSIRNFEINVNSFIQLSKTKSKFYFYNSK